jgi:hypothetical protein
MIKNPRNYSVYKEMNILFKNLIAMDPNTSDVISKLKFIGKIQKGEKINVRSLCVQPNNWFTSIVRTLFNTDNRANAYNFIENIINRAFDIINYNRVSISIVNRQIVQNVILDLKQAVIGISNMKDTYEFDVMYCCKLDTLTQSINSRIGEIEVIDINMNEVD